MKNYLLILFLIFYSTFIIAQKRDAVWVTGYNCCNPDPNNTYAQGLIFDFSSGSFQFDTVTRKMNFGTMNASICDTTGILLFYTNGIFIADRTNDTMMNGSGINPSFYTSMQTPYGLNGPQSDIIIPKPDDPNQYYLFHKTADTVSTPFSNVSLKLYFSIIDMSGNNGYGAVISKNNILLTETYFGINMTAVRHGNGRDWWIIQTKANSNKYFIFLLTNTGVSLHQTQIIGSGYDIFCHCNFIFSKDGSKFINGATDFDRIEVMDFDRCTGLFSNPISIPVNYYGQHYVSLSASDRYLYYNVSDTIFQYDMAASNIAATKTVVAVYDGFESPPGVPIKFGHPILAADNKIYFTFNLKYLHVINYPDSAGLACNVVQHAIQLPYNTSGFPNFPNYELGRISGSACDTVYSSISELEKEKEVSVFPNPSLTGIFNFRFDDKSVEIKSLEVTDITGRIINSLLNKSNQLNLSSAADGIYFYRVKTNKGKMYNGKIIIQ